MNKSKRRILKAAGALPLLGLGSAFSQQFPSKPIKIVVPASPGTSIDAVTRFFVEPLSKRLNTPIMVENRSGAGGLLGYTAVAKAPPDGHTLILTGIPLYLLPLFAEGPTPPFDSLKDFAPVARTSRVPLAIVVGPDSPYKTMQDLVQAMRNRPNDVTYSSQGIGSTAHLCSVVLNDQTKTRGQHVGYKETTMAITDVIGGRIGFTCQTSVAVLPLHQSGKLRILGITGSSRWEAVPDIPTVEESGFKGFEVSSQLDFMAPAKTPDAILQVLSDEITAIVKSPQFKEFCTKQILTQDAMGYKDLGQEMVREAARWKRIVQLARAS